MLARGLSNVNINFTQSSGGKTLWSNPLGRTFFQCLRDFFLLSLGGGPNIQRSSACNPKKEMPALIPGSQSRHIFVEGWTDGRRTAFDVSVILPTQDAVVDRAANIAASAIDHRKSEKVRKHADNCRASGIVFEPLVVETFGGWDPGAVKLLKAMASNCAPRKSLPRPWKSNNSFRDFQSLYNAKMRPCCYVETTILSKCVFPQIHLTHW